MLINDSDIAVHLHSTIKTSKREAQLAEFHENGIGEFCPIGDGKRKV